MPFVMRPLQPIPELEVHAPIAMQEYEPVMRKRMFDEDGEGYNEGSLPPESSSEDAKNKKDDEITPKNKGPKSSAFSQTKSIPLLVTVILLINWFVNII